MSDSTASATTQRFRLAAMDPSAVVWLGEFWRAHKDVQIVLVLAIGIAVALAPFTYVSGSLWWLLSAFIQVVGIGGVLIAIRAFASIAVEQSIAQASEAQCDEYMRQLRTGRRERPRIDDLESLVLPANPSSPPPAMIRLFQQICREARDRASEPAGMIMQPYREEALGPLFKLQNLQKVSLWLGILGTFIGLLLAISARNVGGEQSSDAVLRMVDSMFRSLSLSFSASVAGLQVAIVLGLLIHSLRSRQERYFQRMESTVSAMVSLARNALVEDDFLTEFRQVTAAVTQLHQDVYDQTGVIRAQQEAIRTQTSVLTDSLDRLSAARVHLDGFLATLERDQAQFLGDLEKVHDKASLADLSKVLESGVQRVGEELRASLEPTTRLSGRLDGFMESASALVSAFGSRMERDDASLARLESAVERAATINVSAIDKLVSGKNHRADGINRARGRRRDASIPLERGFASDEAVVPNHDTARFGGLRRWFAGVFAGVRRPESK